MKTQFTFCLLFAFCLGAATETKAQVNVNDSFALVDLYNSTNGSEWTHHDNWLTSPVGHWFGISLTSDGKRVSKIQLNSNNLTGHLPSALGNLSSLSFLQLSNNQI